jgi:hypothetical protein
MARSTFSNAIIVKSIRPMEMLWIIKIVYNLISYKKYSSNFYIGVTQIVFYDCFLLSIYPQYVANRIRLGESGIVYLLICTLVKRTFSSHNSLSVGLKTEFYFMFQKSLNLKQHSYCRTTWRNLHNKILFLILIQRTTIHSSEICKNNSFFQQFIPTCFLNLRLPKVANY